MVGSAKSNVELLHDPNLQTGLRLKLDLFIKYQVVHILQRFLNYYLSYKLTIPVSGFFFSEILQLSLFSGQVSCLVRGVRLPSNLHGCREIHSRSC